MLYTSNKKGTPLFKRFLLFVIICCFVNFSFAQQPTAKADSVAKDSMTQKFYAINHEPLYWLSSRKDSKRATEWLTAIETAKKYGIVSGKHTTSQVRTAMLANNTRYRVNNVNTDKQITTLVLNFIKELHEVNAHFEYDGLSSQLSDSVYIHLLMNSKNKGPVSNIISKLDCQDHDYQVLKNI